MKSHGLFGAGLATPLFQINVRIWDLGFEAKGGVEKPEGFFNTKCLTGRGGLLNYPGGFLTDVW